MAGLVSLGIATQQQIDDLKMLQWIDVPWTESNELPEIGIGMVYNARKQIVGGVVNG